MPAGGGFGVDIRWVCAGIYGTSVAAMSGEAVRAVQATSKRAGIKNDTMPFTFMHTSKVNAMDARKA
jgi:hypothetical protein